MTTSLHLEAKQNPGNRAAIFLTALLAVGIVLAGCGQMPSTPVPAFMQSAPTSAKVTLCDSTAASCADSTSFSLAAMRDLNISVAWQNVTQDTHTQTTRVFTPNGELFQATEVAFLIPEGSDGTTTTLQTLPVVGTWITARQMTGQWTITVDLDGQPMATSSVQLTQ